MQIGLGVGPMFSGSAAAANAFVTNLVQKSNAFTTSPWTSATTPFIANQSVSPDGTLDAWAGNSAVGVTNQTTQIMTGQVSTSKQTLSIYVKQKDAAGFGLGVFDSTSAAFIATWNGTWTSGVPVVPSAKVENVGNGWFRISGSYTGAVAGHNLRYFIYPESATAGSCTGKGNYFFGAQIANGGAAGRYTPNP